MECFQPSGIERSRVSIFTVSLMCLPMLCVVWAFPFRVKYILNISREIDNFYPEEFKYLNIRFATLLPLVLVCT